MGRDWFIKKLSSFKRNLDERAKKAEVERQIARKFGKEFFDGDRRFGYGGFNYNLSSGQMSLRILLTIGN